jgi:hypothetical protein
MLLSPALRLALLLGVVTACGGRSVGGDGGEPSASSPAPAVPIEPARAGRPTPPTAGPDRRPPMTGGDTPVTDGSDGPTQPATVAGVQVLETYCGGCHGAEARADGNVQGGFSDIDDVDALVERGWVVPLSASGSLIVQVMLDGRMPPRNAPRPDAAEVQWVIDFIDNPRFWPEPAAGVDGGATADPGRALDAGVDAG